MQYIYNRAPMTSMFSTILQSNFIEIALWHGCSPVSFLHIVRTYLPIASITFHFSYCRFVWMSHSHNLKEINCIYDRAPRLVY